MVKIVIFWEVMLLDVVKLTKLTDVSDHIYGSTGMQDNSYYL